MLVSKKKFISCIVIIIGFIVDVVGCITEIGGLTSVTSRKGNSIPLRKLTFEDSTGKIEVSIWYKMASFPPFELYDVIGFTGILVNQFRNQISLNTKHAAFRILDHDLYSLSFLQVLQWYGVSLHFRVSKLIIVFICRREQKYNISSLKLSSASTIKSKQDDDLFNEILENTKNPQKECKQTNKRKQNPSKITKVNLPLKEKSKQITNNNKLIVNWTTNDVVSWLKTIKLEKYQKIFTKNEITGKDLISITSEELQSELLIYKFSDRKKILKQIKQIKLSSSIILSNHENNPYHLIQFIKELSFLLSTKNDYKEIYFALEFFYNTYNLEIQTIQQILIHLQPSIVLNLIDNFQNENLKLPCILATSQRNFIKRLKKKTSISENFSNILVHCICPHEFIHFNLFKQRKLDKIEEKMITLVHSHSSFRVNSSLSSSICNRSDFIEKFQEFTSNQLKYLNWENCIVAGGSILACLSNDISLSSMQEQNRKFNANDPWNSSDIDIFLIGLKKHLWNDKIIEIYNSICKVNFNEILVVRTKNCVSFVSQYPFRTVQVILREYECYADVIAHFDLDCISLCYNGESVYATPNSIRSLSTHCNFIDEQYLQYGISSSITRICKYSKRGYACKLYHKDLLLLSELTPKMEGRVLYLRYLDEKNSSSSPPSDLCAPAASKKNSSFNNVGYDDTYLPYGPTHNAASIKEQLNESKNNSKELPFFIFGSLSFCLDEANVPAHLL